MAGGWAASFAVTAHTGYPITVQNSVRTLAAGHAFGRVARPGSATRCRPTRRSSAGSIGPRSPSPALGTFGNAGVGILRAPGYWNVDLSLSKRFATFGRQYLQFRGEMFNVLNHPNFGPPDRNIQSQTFGTITGTVGDARVVQLVLKYHF